MVLNINRIPSRAGVIPYIRLSGRTLLCLGQDYETGELTDFGGFISPKIDLTPVHGAFREFNEETYGAFGRVRPFSRHKKQGMFYSRMLIIYVELHDVDLEKVTDRFQRNMAVARTKEIKNLVWLDKDTLMSYINGDGNLDIYQPVLDHLKFSKKFISDL